MPPAARVAPMNICRETLHSYKFMNAWKASVERSRKLDKTKSFFSPHWEESRTVRRLGSGGVLKYKFSMLGRRGVLPKKNRICKTVWIWRQLGQVDSSCILKLQLCNIVAQRGTSIPSPSRGGRDLGRPSLPSGQTFLGRSARCATKPESEVGLPHKFNLTERCHL